MIDLRAAAHGVALATALALPALAQDLSGVTLRIGDQVGEQRAVVVGVAGAVLPARRGSHIDVLEALRHE